MDEDANGVGSPKQEGPIPKLSTQKQTTIDQPKKLMFYRRYSANVSWPFTHNVSDNR